MSLIQTAVEKARKLSEASALSAPKRGEPESVTTPQARERRTQPNAAEVAARAARARVVPVTSVDAAIMERHGVLPQVSDTAAQRSYRILRTKVQQRMQAQGWHSIAVTGAGASEGKTLTSINLALSLAKDVNTWVYLVDLDLQRPQVAAYFGMQFQKGLSDYIAGTAQFDDILYNPGVERLTVVPNGQPLEFSSDVLGSPRVRELCQSLAAEVPRPIVIFDMPPLLLSDDVLKFYPNVDCTLFVVSEGVTARATIQRAHEVLQDMQVLGVVLNRSAERVEGGYY